MNREYVVSKRAKIGYYALAAFFIAIAVVLVVVAVNAVNATPAYFIAVFIAIFPPFLLVNVIKKKVIVDDYTLTSIALFSTKQLQLNDIKGYRIVVNKSSRSVVFESNSGMGKITVSNANELTDKDEFFDWLQTKFTDLDAADVQLEKEDVLQNTALGATEEEREASLKKAKRLTIGFAVLGAIIGFMNLFYDAKIWAIADVVYPFLGVVLIFTGKGLIKFVVNSKRSVYPQIIVGMIVLGFVCALASSTSGELYDSGNLWKPALIFTTVLFVAFYFTGTNKSMAVGWQIATMLIVAGLFGFGNTVHINTVFDASQPRIYRARIDNKKISSGKHTSYNLYISEWGPESVSSTIDVGSRFYNNVNVGDSVTMYYRPGALNIPWYKIAR